MALGPAAALSDNLCRECEGYITSVVHGTDPIPRLRWATPRQGAGWAGVGGAGRGVAGQRGAAPCEWTRC